MQVQLKPERTSLRAQIRELLRTQVILGELAPGEIYSAVALASRLGVSPTPVREAMQELAAAGLVEAVRNRGFRIVSVSESDLDEIVEIRIWLEVPAAQRAIELAGDAEMEQLLPLAEEIVAAAKRGDPREFLLADNEFHRALLALAGNERLLRTVQELRDQTRLLGIERLSHSGQLEASAAEHLAIVDALLARNGERARTLMEAHLRHARGIWAARTEGG